MICGILLAAGSGSRFGTDKLLYTLSDGVAVAVAAARNLAAGVDRVVAVVRPGTDRLAELLVAADAEVVICADAARGMGTSLAWGVRASADASGWLVALADMPFIRPATVQAVAGLIRRDEVLAAPVYGGRRGHPVGFGRMFGSLLGELQGDTGAREILRVHAEYLTLLPCDDPGVLWDIDVPDDLSYGPAKLIACRRLT